MAITASHPAQATVSPEISGAEFLGTGIPLAEAPVENHAYGVYVLEGVEHKDGSSGLIFSFNPDFLPLKDKDTQQIARNVRLSLLPLKRREQALKSEIAGKEIPESNLSFSVEASESPLRVVKNGEILEDENEEVMALTGDGADGDKYVVMHGWPAVRLDYDTSLIDHASLIRAVSYILSSNLPESQQELWMQDMSISGANVERLLDPDTVKPGNPNKLIREWVSGLLEKNNNRSSARFAKIAASLSSLIKV